MVTATGIRQLSTSSDFGVNDSGESNPDWNFRYDASLAGYIFNMKTTGLAAGHYLLDFNTAYNPACAFSEHYNCPIPPKANDLKVAMRAGEMDAHYH